MVAATQLHVVSVDFLLRLGDKAAHVSAADVAGDHDTALPPFARDRGRSLDLFYVSQRGERHALPAGRCHQHFADGLRAGPKPLRQADHQGEAELPFHNFA